jgi:hypothetical protein
MSSPAEPIRIGLIDAASKRTLQRFGLRLGLLALFDMAGGRNELHTFIAMVDMAALFTCACAIFSKEKPGRGSLNQWDEALAMFGVRCAAVWLLSVGL